MSEQTSSEQSVVEDLMRRMTPVCSAKDALERIDRYLAAPMPSRTKLVLCQATIQIWKDVGANR